MKLFIITALMSVFTALSAAAPNIADGIKDLQFLEATTDHTLDPRGSAIELGLGTQHINVGSMGSGDIYGRVYDALLHVCDASQSSCNRDTTATFQVFLDNESRVEAVGVTVEGSQYHGNEKMLRLLIGSVAGSAERGTWNDKSCRTVWTGRRKTRHCNTVDYVSIVFPGDNYLKVRFSGTKNRGGFDCEYIREAAHENIRYLQPEIGREVGDPATYTYVTCLW